MRFFPFAGGSIDADFVQNFCPKLFEIRILFVQNVMSEIQQSEIFGNYCSHESIQKEGK